MEETPILAIRCITYNHEPYIRQCLEGFVMQKTNFPFIAIVHDDASTDGTADIIREFEVKYPDIIKPIYETENQWSKGKGGHQKAIDLVMPEGVKYIAMCEGDDYWTNPNKLQMQVDFLEGNPEYGMCYGRAKQWIQKKQRFSIKCWGEETTTYEQLFYKANGIPTLTVVLRNDIRQKYIEEIHPENKGWKMGDYPLWLYFSKQAKIKYFQNVLGVYRVLDKSASHFDTAEKYVSFQKSAYDMKLFYAKLYGNECPVFSETNFKFSFYFIHNMRKEAYQLLCESDEKSIKQEIKKIIFRNNFLFRLYSFRMKLKIYFFTRRICF